MRVTLFHAVISAAALLVAIVLALAAIGAVALVLYSMQ